MDVLWIIPKALLLGLIIGAIVTAIALSGRLAQAGSPKKLFYLARSVEFIAIVPALCLHPAVLVALLFGPVSESLAASPIPLILSNSTTGIVLVGSILYFPYGWAFLQGAPFERWMEEWRYARHLGAPGIRSGLTLFLGPSIRTGAVLISIICVLAQGMVFAPHISKATWKTTLGRELYGGVVVGSRLFSSSVILLFSLIIVGFLAAVIRLRFLKREEVKRSSDWSVEPTGFGLLTLLKAALIVPSAILASICLLATGLLIAKLVGALRTAGWPAILEALTSDAVDAPILASLYNTLFVGIGGCLLGTLCAILIVGLVTWKGGLGGRSRAAKVLFATATVITLTPTIAYGATVHSLLLKAPRVTLIALIAFITSAWLAVIFGEELTREIEAHRLLRRSFNLTFLAGVRGRLQEAASLLALLGFYALVLGINEMALQLAAGTSFISLPQRLMPLARDGLSLSQWGAIGLIQVALLVLFIAMGVVAIIGAGKARQGR